MQYRANRKAAINCRESFMNRLAQHTVRCANCLEQRRGTVLVATAIVLTALIGLLGLVIDAGQLMIAHRQTQNAADAAATAAAMDMLSGNSQSTAKITAATFVQQYNGLATAIVTVNIPPASGPHSSSSQYAEAIVSYPVAMRFIQVLGVASKQTVVARAVAGYEGSSNGASVLVLDPNARPGFSASGNGSLKVNGTFVDNSNGGGMNQLGKPLNNGNTGSAISLSGNATLSAINVESVGGVTTSGNASIQNYNGGSQSPLQTGVAIAPDPLLNLPTPTTANGAIATNYAAVNLSGNQSATLSPGVYPSINLSGNASATFNPGIYVIAGGGMSISGNGNATGSGVMIYNTGSNYNVNTGLPDSADLSQAPPASGNASFGALSLSGNGSILFTPVATASSPFDGMGFYQRRLNTQPISISGNGSVGAFKGTIYAKWAPLTLSGNGTYASQFVVQSMTLSGNASITVDSTGQNLAKINLTYLVE
jgi:Flp pilus assembly protein TadG